MKLRDESLDSDFVDERSCWKNANRNRKDTCVLEGTQIVYRDDVTKNSASNAILPLPDNLREYLLQLKEKQFATKKFLGKGYTDTGLVCTYQDGKGIKPGYVSENFHKMLIANNLRVIRFHDLRHTVGTLI